jgi:hypothetical protein
VKADRCHTAGPRPQLARRQSARGPLQIGSRLEQRMRRRLEKWRDRWDGPSKPELGSIISTAESIHRARQR